MIKIYLASDHAGVELKSKIYKALLDPDFSKEIRREIHDLGPQSTDSVDYPDYADILCRKLHGFSLISSDAPAKIQLKDFGILICGSGQGMSMRANKWDHIRAALCWTSEVAKRAREHNDANVLCLGSRVIDHDLCIEIVKTFMTTVFLGGRHAQRVAKINLQLP